MAYVPRKAGTLLIPSGSIAKPDGKHLFVILNDVCRDGCHALVSISTIREGQHHDATCIVEAGEHEFVQRKSYIEYRMARIEKSAHLIKCVSGWTFIEKVSVSEALFGRILGGVEASDFTPQFVQKYIKSLAR